MACLQLAQFGVSVATLVLLIALCAFLFRDLKW